MYTKSIKHVEESQADSLASHCALGLEKTQVSSSQLELLQLVVNED